MPQLDFLTYPSIYYLLIFFGSLIYLSSFFAVVGLYTFITVVYYSLIIKVFNFWKVPHIWILANINIKYVRLRMKGGQFDSTRYKITEENIVFNVKSHPFLILSSSWRPFWLSIGLLLFVQELPILLSNGTTALFVNPETDLVDYRVLIHLIIGFITISFAIYDWASDLFKEASSSKKYNKYVQRNIATGFSLFIASEFMLFLSFFAAFFYVAVSPSIFIGHVWPPVGIVTLSAYSLPLLNTILLLSSGVFTNWFYYTVKSFVVYSKSNYINPDAYTKRNRFLFPKSAFVSTLKLYQMFNYYLFFIDVLNRRGEAVVGYIFIANILKLFFKFLIVHFLRLLDITVFNYIYLTLAPSFYYFTLVSIKLRNLYTGLNLILLCGSLFLIFQYTEYFYHATFNFQGIYGSVFYSLTGLHGLHVFLGLFLFFVIYNKFLSSGNSYHNHLLHKYHVGITCAVWYWHFVDFIWLCLYIAVYIWGA